MSYLNLAGWVKNAVVLLLFFAFHVNAAPKADLWQYWSAPGSASSGSGYSATNYQRVSHSEWDNLLKRYVVTNHASGINRFRYGDVTRGDARRLDKYINSLAKLDPRSLSRREQKAYWMNLYNALTVQLVLENYPVTSITDIRGETRRESTPWKKKVIRINQHWLTLNDIEHRILRPIWNDHRIHFGLACAGLGCPNILPQAFTASNSKRLLQKAGEDFIRHPRGLAFNGKELQLSKLFEWYRNDFADSEKGLKKFLTYYADDKAALYLLGHSGKVVYEHDWRLNAP